MLAEMYMLQLEMLRRQRQETLQRQHPALHAIYDRRFLPIALPLAPFVVR